MKKTILYIVLSVLLFACDSMKSKYGFTKSDVQSITVVDVLSSSGNKSWNLDSTQRKIFLDELDNSEPKGPLTFIKYRVYAIEITLNSGKTIKMDALDGNVISPIDSAAYVFRKGFVLKDLLK